MQVFWHFFFIYFSTFFAPVSEGAKHPIFNEITARGQRDYGSLVTRLRLAKMWGSTFILQYCIAFTFRRSGEK